MRLPEFPALPRGLMVAVLAVTLAAGLSACGRRGRPEAPPDPSVAPAASQTTPAPKGRTASRTTSGGATTADATPAAATPAAATPAPTATGSESDGSPFAVFGLGSDDDETDPAASVNPSPTPRARRKTPFAVPKEPFILDPLL